MASGLVVTVSSESEDDADYIPPENDGSGCSCDDSGNISDIEHLKKYDRTVSESKRFHNITENSRIFPRIEKKKRAEDVWNNFLNDVMETEKSVRYTSVKTVNNSESEMKSQHVSTSTIFELNLKTDCNMDKTNNPLNCTISTEENAAIVNSSNHLSGKRINVDSVLQVVQTKRQKANVLQKALHEWNNFKRIEGIEEDLRKFNKGKQGFLERQRFLQRSELRCFETEKVLRHSLKKA
ncbi:hypothetical protein AVEN_200214-1 [Araneus ventricosus]|uniref:Craniofacial development protein 1 n=1 Tax=Araneus ventricosus TaxID=182803 RepID=A0A4Y2P6V4_ARAVE|nr:hypothetical protein AVEN_200214-1 [Araneus ventricosus]